MFKEMKVFDWLEFPPDIQDALEVMGEVFEYAGRYSEFSPSISIEKTDCFSEEEKQAYRVIQEYIMNETGTDETVLIY